MRQGNQFPALAFLRREQPGGEQQGRPTGCR